MYAFLKDADTNNYSSKTLLTSNAAGCLHSVRVHWLARLSSPTVPVTEWQLTTLLFLDLVACFFVFVFTVAKGSPYQDSIEKSWSEGEVHKNAMLFYLKIRKIVLCMQSFIPNPYLTSHCGAVLFLLFKAMVVGEGFLLSHYVVFYMWASYLRDSCKEKIKKCCCPYLRSVPGYV